MAGNNGQAAQAAKPEQSRQPERQKKLSYENAVAELESTVQRLELEDVSLDESIRLFSRGVELTAMCNTILGEIEGKIVRLVESGPGEIKEEPYS